MVGKRIEPELRVRFLIDEDKKFRGARISPWKLYRYNEKMLEIIDLPYETLENGPLLVGSRLERMIHHILPNQGCCSSCTELQMLLDSASDEWILKHADEIVDRIHRNAREKFKIRVPRRMIRATLEAAIFAERFRYRLKYSKLLGKEGR